MNTITVLYYFFKFGLRDLEFLVIRIPQYFKLGFL
jgi:hypothetical protein